MKPGTFEILLNLLSNAIKFTPKGGEIIFLYGEMGVGKTTFLFDYIKKAYLDDNTVLYINLNNFYLL